MLRYYVRWTAPDLSTTVRRFNKESDAVDSPDNMIEGA